MSKKELPYHGYDIVVDKEDGLTSFSVYRQSDGLEIICDFTEGNDSVSTIIKCMKERVDEFILTKGASEELEDDYETI